AAGASPTRSPAPTSIPGSNPSAPNDRRAQTASGVFKLTFESPKTAWRSADAIEGTATLSLAAGGGVDLGGSGSGLIGFDFAEVGGSRHVEPAATADCRPYRLDPGAPIASPIRKSGGFYPEQTNYEFYRSF